MRGAAGVLESGCDRLSPSFFKFAPTPRHRLFIVDIVLPILVLICAAALSLGFLRMAIPQFTRAKASVSSAEDFVPFLRVAVRPHRCIHEPSWRPGGIGQRYAGGLFTVQLGRPCESGAPEWWHVKANKWRQTARSWTSSQRYITVARDPPRAKERLAGEPPGTKTKILSVDGRCLPPGRASLSP